jgi:hypothetical protein
LALAFRPLEITASFIAAMGHRLRVFLSSTMRDLENERDAVVRALKALNVEVANAESWTPSGADSWTRIRDELESSHLMVLLLGERYGWIPDKGPGAVEQMSVTEMEYRAAIELGLPVLPFLKNLPYDATRDTDDARRRDRFRKEVLDWAGGRFSGKFDLASDLAGHVADAVVNLLVDGFLRESIARRAMKPPAAAWVRKVAESSPRYRSAELPADLLDAVRAGRAVLFAGSGVSLSAGFPSAAAFVRLFRSRVGDDQAVDDYRMAASQFATAAADFEAYAGRDALRHQIASLLDPAQGVGPTVTHLIATKRFKTIITTNFDSLFETAALQSGHPWQIFVESTGGGLPPYSLVKLHGSIHSDEGLILTEVDLALIDQSKPELWAAVRSALSRHPVVVVGSSLRDPSVVRLFASLPKNQVRYVVLPEMDRTNERRLANWRFTPVVMDSDGFFEALEDALSSGTGSKTQ